MDLPALTALVHHLLQLQRERATGALTVSDQDQQTVVYFQGGRAVFADSPAVSLTLGRLLLETGVITHQQYTIAIGELRRTVSSDRNAKLGGILVTLGFCTVEEIQDALFRQMARRVAGLMDYAQPTWAFASGDSVIQKVPKYPMRVEPLIFDGIRLYFDRARMTKTLSRYRGGFIMLRAPVELVSRCFSLSPELEYVVATIDGKSTTESWLMEQTHDDAWPLLTALALAGVIAVARAAPPPQVVASEAKKNPSLAPPGNTGVFEVPPIKPVVVPTDVAFASKAQDRPAPAAPPDPQQLARLEAEGAARMGMDLMHAGEHESAAAQFRIATTAMPRVAEYKLYWRWCVARTQGSFDPATLEELTQLAATTARHDSRHAFPPYVSAYIALERDDEQTAMRFFKVAYRRDPDNKDAGNQLRRLERKKR